MVATSASFGMMTAGGRERGEWTEKEGGGGGVEVMEEKVGEGEMMTGKGCVCECGGVVEGILVRE